VCSKSNSIIFCLSLFDPVSLSLSTALHTYFPHPSSSLSQAFIHIFPISLSLSLSWTSHIALIYRFWKWQPDILDYIVCHNKICLNTYNLSYYFVFNSGCCKFRMKQRRHVAPRTNSRTSIMRARDILTYYTQNIRNVVPLIDCYVPFDIPATQSKKMTFIHLSNRSVCLSVCLPACLSVHFSTSNKA